MGSVLHPVGSEPPGVYWRRRALIAAGVVVVAALVVWLLWPRADSAVTATPAPVPSQVASGPTAAGANPSTSAGPSASGPASKDSASPDATSPAASSPATTTAAPAVPADCDAAAIQVGLAGYGTVKAGGSQPFRVTLTNTSAADCVLRVSAKTLVVTVSSGKDRIWSTADCDAWLPGSTGTVSPQKAQVVAIDWTVSRSAKGCSLSKDLLKKGTYLATATFGGQKEATKAMQVTAG